MKQPETRIGWLRFYLLRLPFVLLFILSGLILEFFLELPFRMAMAFDATGRPVRPRENPPSNTVSIPAKQSPR